MKRIAGLIFLLSVCFLAKAQTDSLPDLRIGRETSRGLWRRLYIPVQFAGNIGFLSGGIGYKPLTDKYQLSLLYGYTPSSVSEVPCHLLTAKNIFHIHRFRLSDARTLIPYGSVGISLEVSGRSFFTQPDVMPDSYYDFPNSLHAIPTLGIKLRHANFKFRGFHATEFFAEATSVDAYIWYKIRSNDIKIRDIVSVAFGVHFLCQ